MDGTLVDNKIAHTQAFEVWAERRGFPMEKDFILKYYGMGNDDIMPALVGDPNLSKELIDIYAQEKEAVYREIYAKTIELVAGARQLFDELKKQGVKLAVASSAPIINVDFVLDATDIRGYFDAITHSGLVKKAKPAPDVFLLAAQMMGLKPEECFVFEDAFAGVAAARAAGMKVGVLTTTFAREQHKDYDILIDDFTQVSLNDIL